MQSESYVQTCGLCETICNEDEISTHECLEGYDNYITDKNLYFYSLLGMYKIYIFYIDKEI